MRTSMPDETGDAGVRTEGRSDFVVMNDEEIVQRHYKRAR